MFTSNKKPGFDSVALVEVEAKQSPVDGAPHLKMELCYVDSRSGTTYGHISLEHNEPAGKVVISEKTLKAWSEFCRCVEEDQGAIIFGDGKFVSQMDMFGMNDDQAESDEGINVGLGGGT